MRDPDAFAALYEREAETVLLFVTRRTADADASRSRAGRRVADPDGGPSWTSGLGKVVTRGRMAVALMGDGREAGFVSIPGPPIATRRTLALNVDGPGRYATPGPARPASAAQVCAT